MIFVFSLPVCLKTYLILEGENKCRLTTWLSLYCVPWGVCGTIFYCTNYKLPIFLPLLRLSIQFNQQQTLCNVELALIIIFCLLFVFIYF